MAETSTKPRVLFVDDEPLVLQGLQLHLRTRFEVDTATSGQEGLAKMDEHEYVVIVSDMRMPEMNGAEFLRHAREKAPDTVRILLTGYADTDSAIQAVNEGQIFRFLTKPIRPPDLISAVFDAVNEHRRKTLDRSLLKKEVSRVSRRIVDTQRLAQLGELATDSANELANLAAIHKSMLTAISSRAAAGGPVTAEDLADLRWIEESLRRHADHLSEFASAETARAELTDLRDAAARTLELLQVMGTLKHVPIDFEFASDLPLVSAAPGRLQHAIMNLVVNAIDAVESQDPHEARIDVNVFHRKSDDLVVCEVRDNGVGVHPEARPFVMKPYFTTKDGAAGLGLPVAAQIAAAYGGSIEFESKYGDGAAFRLVLPPHHPGKETPPGHGPIEDLALEGD